MCGYCLAAIYFCIVTNNIFGFLEVNLGMVAMSVFSLMNTKDYFRHHIVVRHVPSYHGN